MMPGLLYLVVQLFRRHCGRVVSLVLTVARHSGGVDKESLNRGRHQHAKRLKQHPYSGKHEGCSVFWSQVCLFVWMFVCLFVWLFVWFFVCLFDSLFVCLCDCLFDPLFVCLFDSLFVCLILCLIFCLFVCLILCLFCLLWVYTDRRWWFGLMLIRTLGGVCVYTDRQRWYMDWL